MPTPGAIIFLHSRLQVATMRDMFVRFSSSRNCNLHFVEHILIWVRFPFFDQLSVEPFLLGVNPARIPRARCPTGGVDYKTGNMCGYKTGIMCGYKTNHSKNFCAGTTAIRPITRKLRKFRRKIEFWCIWRKKNFRFFSGSKHNICKRSFLRIWLL